MSIKDTFKKKSNKILQSTSLDNLGSEIESVDYEKALLEDKKRFIPDIDFSNISNFTKFGSAEKYYYDSITSIYATYPYDGSLYEKLNWHNKNSDITNYIFENVYPRTNGYANIGKTYGSISATTSSYSLTSNPEYILLKGGPNSSSEITLRKKFEKANKLDTINNRDYNLYLNGVDGFTTEFWFNKLTTGSQSPTQVIFDLWNSGTVSYTAGAPCGRFRIELSTSSLNQFTVVVTSGSSGTAELGVAIGSDLNLTASSWNHYALNVANTGSQLKIDLYKNGQLNSSIITGTSISEVTGAYIATIGSLVTKHENSATTTIGYGKLSGSIDEFRYWKAKRTDKDIKRYWFTQVGGGTNTDDANTNLGVYYKFNEGIYNSSSISEIDKKVLDYSGRISNGYWTGYAVDSRSTESAMTLFSSSYAEFQDPILYSTHPDVVSLLSEKTEEGKEYDLTNNAGLINSFPQWMIDEDSTGLKNLTQLISEYFDDLYIKIKYLPEIHNSTYSSGKPITFASKLLESHGFTTTDLFTDSTILENLLSRTESKNFQDSLSNVKNFIYQNIFNNLTYIYRSKGTEKSIRNLIRCFGVDDNLISLNLYSNNSTFTLKDRFVPVAVKKKYVDFNEPNRFNGTIYQHRDSSNSGTLTYLPGNINTAYTGMTLQAEVYTPFKYEQSNPVYFSVPFVTSSIFGLHSANSSSQDDYTWPVVDTDLQVVAIKDELNSKNAKFKLTSSYFGFELTSSYFLDTYSDSRWNFAIRFSHEKHPYANFVQGSSTGNYIIEFIGKNIISDSILQEFSLSQSVSQVLAEQYFSSAKRIYAGAHRQNFTGSIIQQSDIRISSVRYWLSKLSDDTLVLHAKDPTNYGTESPYEQLLSSDFQNTFTPSAKTLALHWDFENVTGSDNGAGDLSTGSYDGKFIVQDLTSGSFNDSNFGEIGSLTKYQFIGRGDFFLRNQSNVIKREFVSSLKRKLPEVLNDSDMVNILERDDVTFTRDSEPVVHYFTLEKSMYQTISSEMVKLFGSISSLNNLIGEPINRYSQNYKSLDRLKDLFFESVENDVDLEKYMEFYKWFDQSIGDMIEQLIPLSANFSPSLRTVIESHILERNKYWTKYPTLELKQEPPIGVIKAINELKYNWRLGSAPVSRLQNEHCLWWKERAERIGSLNPDRQKILDTSVNTLNRKFSSVYDFNFENIISTNPQHISISGAPQSIKPLIKFSTNSYLVIDLTDFYKNKVCDDK